MSDDRYDERPERPAWAQVPTMPWSRVKPTERRDSGTAPAAPDRRDPERREAERREYERREQEQRERDRRDQDRRDQERRDRDRGRDDRPRDDRPRDDRGRDDQSHDRSHDRPRDDRPRDDRGRDDRARDDRGRERERIEREAYERERAERQRYDRERYERDRVERERTDRERYERDRRGGDRGSRGDRAERDRIERERYEHEWAERERAEREKYDRARDDRDRADRERYARDDRERYARDDRGRDDRGRDDRGRDDRGRDDRAREDRDRPRADDRGRPDDPSRSWTEGRPGPDERVRARAEGRDDRPWIEGTAEQYRARREVDAVEVRPEPRPADYRPVVEAHVVESRPLSTWEPELRSPELRQPDARQPDPPGHDVRPQEPIAQELQLREVPVDPLTAPLPPPQETQRLPDSPLTAEWVAEPAPVVDPTPSVWVQEPPPWNQDADEVEEPEPVLEPPPAEEPIGDPEQALAAVRINYDPTTLHEMPENVYELFRIRDSLTAKVDASADNPSRARLLGLRAVVARMIGDLRPAQADAKMALVHAEATGQLRRIAVAQARLANVLVRLGELDEADRLFTQANSPELPDRLRATIHHYAGKCAFEQDRYIEACQHFEKALELRRDGDPELISATEVALDALFGRVAERGWGPYPRSRDEILLTHKPPAPTFNDQYDRWGYQDAEGGWPIGPQFADVQPFRDGVAWVRPVGIETWGLLDESGRLLIDPRGGYLGVGSFSDDLAWVSRDGQAGWFAVDKFNRVVIQAQFDDVRPFRRGIAIVRQGGKWGAVENNGRLAVQFAFDAFATGLADGRYVEGFTDEGLAIVEVGGRKGVIDRGGRVLVPLAYPTVVIHPVAFLYTDPNQRWGAIGRNGAPLIAAVHPSRKSVTDELDALMADTRPML